MVLLLVFAAAKNNCAATVSVIQTTVQILHIYYTGWGVYENDNHQIDT